ncbi:peptide MFS transporter [Actinomadura algeriensis]|uniref:POT family proton-dependent oligopeptide transporter n=1 Tax=Actinomadura algeriensis TaxID=1679523 RepID=A0ABR9K3A4_9ACTN|nr:oligopeptide:H+ symporter [Actinomadura algeriensis]MBE1537001.1 POT family proton-dependent oligopeptide transporter [Actinomadura algeriensis]
MTTNPPVAQPGQRPPHRSSAHHPKSLWTLAFTELWERFSFYGLQGVLSFYLLYSLSEGGLDLEASTAVSIVGAYGGAVYLAQILGAWTADRLMSPRQAVLQGAIIITLGHLSLAVIPGIAGLAVGLVLIALGTGALKTNISSIVGMLYAEDRDRRDAGFSYFYMAINAGAALGPLLTGLAQTTWGFHAAFALAAIGMVGGLIQYSMKMSTLPAESAVVKNPIDTRGAVQALGIVAGSVLVIALVWGTGLVTSDNLVHFVTGVVLFAAAAYFIVMLRSSAVTAEEKTRVRGFLPLWIASTLYYGFLFQKFTSISVFIRDRVDLFVGGWEMPAAWLSVSSPLAVILFTPLVASIWMRRGARQPLTAVKYAIGLSIIGVAYLLMFLFATLFPGHTVPAVAVLLILALAGSSEIFVGPIGLAIATRIAPERFKNQMVALMLLTLAGGSSISGLLGTLFANIPTGTYFAIVGILPLVLALALAKSAKRIDTLTR